MSLGTSLGWLDGSDDGIDDGALLGWLDGSDEGISLDSLGGLEGSNEGWRDGPNDGASLGTSLGESLGTALGWLDGSDEGMSLGTLLGISLGTSLGTIDGFDEGSGVAGGGGAGQLLSLLAHDRSGQHSSENRHVPSPHATGQLLSLPETHTLLDPVVPAQQNSLESHTVLELPHGGGGVGGGGVGAGAGQFFCLDAHVEGFLSLQQTLLDRHVPPALHGTGSGAMRSLLITGYGAGTGAAFSNGEMGYGAGTGASFSNGNIYVNSRSWSLSSRPPLPPNRLRRAGRGRCFPV